MVFLIIFSIFAKNRKRNMFRNYSKYEVLDDGKIFNYNTKKFLKPTTNHNGYQRVSLVDNEGKRKWYFVHRIVWEAVTGSPIPKGMQINHRSEDKTENMITNLELVSPKENCNFGTRNSRISKSKKGIIPKANPQKQVGAFKDGKLVMIFKSTREARRNGFDNGNVSKCCKNCYLREGNNVYKGYEWRYI